jgi:hypothetical protein
MGILSKMIMELSKVAQTRRSPPVLLIAKAGISSQLVPVLRPLPLGTKVSLVSFSVSLTLIALRERLLILSDPSQSGILHSPKGLPLKRLAN